MTKRSVEVLVLSDIHLGTFGCKAEELLQYLNTVAPQRIVLNGDIIDGWNFKKRYFPPSHFMVIQKLLNFLSEGVKIDYITGNHDEFLRNISDCDIQNLSIVDKLILDIEGRRHWFFHGDVFDMSTKGWAKILARLGGKGYDLLILINHIVNQCLHFFGKPKMSLSKKVKEKVKNAVKYINNFEITAAELAAEQGFEYVICGHIHQPQRRNIRVNDKSVTYLNSGDWIENMSSLEYARGKWSIVYYTKLYDDPMLSSHNTETKIKHPNDLMESIMGGYTYSSNLTNAN